ncbi:FtsX-like permease family protein [bacterium]|nr:FtsX-like permease family protein [bacterium]NBX97866.1 FtsX-like permease family protein [bacterium]NDC95347.1 FtsX-like permease family protein [bacterium]NDD84950.1 FtsX-like permease family protein [bacterium]NDG28710.1 FtsX-like permease family protein [bacterium]
MKRKLNAFWRVTKAGGNNFLRNAWLSIAATAVMTVALTIMLGAVVLHVSTGNAVKELSKKIKVTIYLKDGATEERRDMVKARLQSQEGVDNITFVDRREAERRFKTNQNQQDKAFIEQALALTGATTLPESLEVSLTDLSKSNSIVAIAKEQGYKDVVDDVSVGKNDVAKETIERATSAQRYITRGSIFAAILFAAVSVLIIFNTIRMAIFTRSEEIRIMKLIGATPNYIRGPFLVESCMYGFIAGVLANVAVYTAILSIGPKIQNQAEFSASYALFTSTSVMLISLAGAILVGIMVGIFSSMLAMNKHLKLKHW